MDAISTKFKDVRQQSVEPDGVVFLGDSVQGATIKEDAEYSGVRLTFVAMIQNAQIHCQLFVGSSSRNQITRNVIRDNRHGLQSEIRFQRFSTNLE